MQIPTYWARASFTAVDDDGNPVTRTALGWSSESRNAAENHAQQRAAHAAERARAADSAFERDYDYSRQPPREPLLETLNLNGRTIAAITRNRYGVRVLNSADVLFVDIDLPSGWPNLIERFRGWLRREPADEQAKVINRLKDWQRLRPETSFRIYRTFAGLRLLFTDTTYDPTDPQTHDLLRSLDCDPLYLKLTQRQSCFRARLSPKPWRCGWKRSPSTFPFEDAPREAAYHEWELAYEKRAAKYATCRFITTVGQPRGNPTIDRIVDFHDGAACNPAGAPLA